MMRNALPVARLQQLQPKWRQQLASCLVATGFWAPWLPGAVRAWTPVRRHRALAFAVSCPQVQSLAQGPRRWKAFGLNGAVDGLQLLALHRPLPGSAAGRAPACCQRILEHQPSGRRHVARCRPARRRDSPCRITPAAFWQSRALAIPVFAGALWATVLGNIGSFMRDVGWGLDAGDRTPSSPRPWLPDPDGGHAARLPAGHPRPGCPSHPDRRFLIGVQVLLGAESGTLLVLAQTNTHGGIPGGPDSCGGIGAALMGADLAVHRARTGAAQRELKSAVALNSLASTSPVLSARLADRCWPASRGSRLRPRCAQLCVRDRRPDIGWKRPAAEASALNEKFFWRLPGRAFAPCQS